MVDRASFTLAGECLITATYCFAWTAGNTLYHDYDTHSDYDNDTAFYLLYFGGLYESG